MAGCAQTSELKIVVNNARQVTPRKRKLGIYILQLQLGTQHTFQHRRHPIRPPNQAAKSFTALPGSAPAQLQRRGNTSTIALSSPSVIIWTRPLAVGHALPPAIPPVSS